MKTKLMMIAAMMAACFTMVSCGNAKKQAQPAEQVATAAMSIDEVMAKAADLVDQTVIIEGVYRKHVCAPSCGHVRHNSMPLYLCGNQFVTSLCVLQKPCPGTLCVYQKLPLGNSCVHPKPHLWTALCPWAPGLYQKACWCALQWTR